MSDTGTVYPRRHFVDQVLRYYQLVDAQDIAGLVDLFTADATYARPGYDTIVGHEGLSRFYAEERVIDDGQHVIQTLIAEDSRVAVNGEFHGRLRDGSDVHIRFADFFELSVAGRFQRRDTFFFAPLV